MSILLTQYDGAILGPIAKVIGVIIDFIYNFMDKVFDIQNIGISIIILTFVVYMLMLPLTYKQQKFSKLQSKMSPEIQAIQKKYKGKTDNESRMKIQEETQAVYDKYGVSMTGSCLQLLVQMPIFFALYRVIYNIPAYVSSVRDSYSPLVDQIMNTANYQDKITKLHDTLGMKTVALNFSKTATDDQISNSIIDVLYKLTSDGWHSLEKVFSSLGNVISDVHSSVAHFNNFLGMDIALSPYTTIRNSFTDKSYGLLIMALLIPIVSGLTQFLNLKLSTNKNNGSMNDAMAKQMNTMSMMMPIISVVMVFTLPIGLGLYWIAGAVVRSIQQVVINKRIDKMDMDSIIEKNREKAEKKRAKRQGYMQSQISNAAKIKTKSISVEEREEMLKKAEEAKLNAPEGSMASKANLVKDYNNRNNK